MSSGEISGGLSGMDHKNDCSVCGKELVYLDEDENTECFYCKDPYTSNVRCEAGHYVCDRCHSLAGNDLVEQYCIRSSSREPLKMALDLMKHPQIKMHGPEHHFLVPAVLVTAYHNIKKTDAGRKRSDLKKARQRAEKVLGGFCGFYGDCGAAVGTGIAVSILTGATPLSRLEWRLSNLMTAKSLFTIANHGGPRCCKRNSFLAILEAAAFFQENLEITIPVNPDLKCEFHTLNKECLAGECSFYGT